ncbi:hypothetical protein HanLR1_Chr08g0273851 [Helianthus annuus]|nr:hypothetical protein HanLR1_Chr08g0273851 [Helianthus annuus]
MSIESFKRVYVCTKPYLFMIFLQASYGLNGLVIKCALNKGLNHYTFSVYKNAFAALFIGPFAFFLERYVTSCAIYKNAFAALFYEYVWHEAFRSF